MYLIFKLIVNNILKVIKKHTEVFCIVYINQEEVQIGNCYHTVLKSYKSQSTFDKKKLRNNAK